MPLPLWLEAANTFLPAIAGGLEGGQQDATARFQALLASLPNATRTAGAQAGLPLMDRAFSGLQSRFGLGPATFGHAGDQNRKMQEASAAYRPGMNPSVTGLGNVYDQAMQRFGLNPRRRIQ